jgi:hypothetical protein
MTPGGWEEYPLASGYRYAGKSHAISIPCFAGFALSTLRQFQVPFQVKGARIVI